MRPPGNYKIASRQRSFEDFAEPEQRNERRTRKLIDSLRTQIVEGEHGLRIRRVFTTPREVFRLELELPELGYQRTTLLDRDTLEELLEIDEVRAVLRRRLTVI